MTGYQWIFNQGMSIVVITFMGAMAWRLCFGTKTKKGALETWFEGDLAKRAKHYEKATENDAEARARSAEASQSLHLLVATSAPPSGPAYVAAQQVAKTAIVVASLRDAFMEAARAGRLLADEYPTKKDALLRHCDEIERIICEA